MTHLTGSERAAYVQSMFTRIAGRYDFMNRLMTGGQDVNWRRQVIQRAQLPPGGSDGSQRNLGLDGNCRGCRWKGR